MAGEETAGGQPEENGKEQEPAEFTAITSQEEFDKALSKRLERERAKFSDYDALKKKAEKHDAAEQANKTELEKEREARTAAEARAAAAETSAITARVSGETGVPAEFLRGEDEDAIRAAAKQFLDWRDAGKKAPPAAKSTKSGAAASKSGTADAKERAAEALRGIRNT